MNNLKALFSYKCTSHASHCDSVCRYRIKLVIYVQVLVKELTAHRENEVIHCSDKWAAFQRSGNSLCHGSISFNIF